jgi:p-aminobenzoyl-glutamate transporter AbgT
MIQIASDAAPCLIVTTVMDFYVSGLHPVASIIAIFGGAVNRAVNRNSIYPNVLIITITHPLHVSAPTGHLQVE